MKQTTGKKNITLKVLNKTNIWDIQENDIFLLWEDANNDNDSKSSFKRFLDIVRTAFNVEDISNEPSAVKAKYDRLGYTTGVFEVESGDKKTMAIKKRPILRVTDLTYENIHHITAEKLIEVLDRNFGGGWDSLSQSIKDIIESGFDISTTTLPKDRLHKPGGMYDKKVADGYAVLEVLKGTWVEAIFAKVKPEIEKPKIKLMSENSFNEFEDDDDDEIDDLRKSEIDDDDEFDEDEIDESNYRTTFEIATDEDGLSDDFSDLTIDDDSEL